LQIHQAHPATRATELLPGELSLETTHLSVGCSERTVLELIELQPEGKRRMPSRDFINGYRPQTGEKLGE
jgi:methionyl-tRNA formyltransferase